MDKSNGTYIVACMGAALFAVVLFLMARGSISSGALPEEADDVGIERKEKYYTELIAGFLKAKTWVKQVDGTIPDMITDDIVWEIEFSRKWYESIGQTCHYARLTDKRPGIFLIAQSIEDEKYVQKAMLTARVTRVTLKDGYAYSVTVLVYRDYL